MNDRVIRVREVAGILGISKSTVWLWNSKGKLPKSFKLTPSTTVWRFSEIMDWLDAKQQGSDENENAPSQVDHTKPKSSQKENSLRKKM